MATPRNKKSRENTPRQAARRSATDEKITAAVLALGRREGLGAVSIDAVAAESGVAKTTIYRRYDDRSQMLDAVARELASPPEQDYPVTQAGLCELLAEIREIFEAQVGISAVGGILASQGEDLDEWQHRVVEPNLARLRSFFARGVKEGQLRPEVDYEQLIEMITGGMFVSDALRDDVPEEWAPNLVALMWPTISR
ncbi:TetR/AcrR family transcriptional regulator [Corynebacterium halotolerans]|uniref:TetR family transcriptional regulator n=1 Tax=Corynebacterium halotolerans YIM 70093 = DSM 44683 TaxID=1121362 RepID=M1MVG5_9CORY|nr:TetR/AcrR family transcriptional regulator [Corynebacterium halotolerans]AGF71719.1 TetR family transcriptional regulator [Corynebacterium halotolerans YIM 70093 = DSM 44683]